MKESYLYEKLDELVVGCFLCEHRCKINEGKKGICGVRENRRGTLYSLVYGIASALNIDPIEKKPLYHFYPGSQALSIATIGCNFLCRFCQNHDISQASRREWGLRSDKKLLPDDIVRIAVEASCRSISYTYTEPTIFFEYAYDTAMLAVKEGIKNNFVTNGFMTSEMLNMVKPFLHAANVDLKCFNDKTYRKLMGGRLGPILDNIRLMKEIGIWVEVTTLVIPGVNDSDEELKQIAEYIASVGSEIPWHVSRYHPDYNFHDAPATPEKRIISAREIGIASGLKYVYTGNIFNQEGNTTFCYSCGEALIKRTGLSVEKYNVVDGKCPRCYTSLDGAGM